MAAYLVWTEDNAGSSPAHLTINPLFTEVYTMTQEYVSIRFKVYRDKEGNPACVSNFEMGDVCEFYRTYRFGFNETCVFAPDI